MSELLVIPETRNAMSFLERLEGNAPQFRITTPKGTFEFWCNASQRPRPFSVTVHCQIADVSSHLIISPELWNHLFKAFAGEEDLSKLPPELAQAVIAAGANQLVEKFSHCLGYQLAITKLQHDLPKSDSDAFDELCFTVKTSGIEGLIAIRYKRIDRQQVEAILGNIWQKVLPHFEVKSHQVALEYGRVPLNEDQIQNLAVSDVLFPSNESVVPHHQDFILRWDLDTAWYGVINDGQATLSEPIDHAAIAAKGDDATYLTLECGQATLELRDPSELQSGFGLSHHTMRDFDQEIAIRYKGILIGTGRKIFIGGRAGVVIQEILDLALEDI